MVFYFDYIGPQCYSVCRERIKFCQGNKLQYIFYYYYFVFNFFRLFHAYFNGHLCSFAVKYFWFCLGFLCEISRFLDFVNRQLFFFYFSIYSLIFSFSAFCLTIFFPFVSFKYGFLIIILDTARKLRYNYEKKIAK